VSLTTAAPLLEQPACERLWSTVGKIVLEPTVALFHGVICRARSAGGWLYFRRYLVTKEEDSVNFYRAMAPQKSFYGYGKRLALVWQGANI
jgi:hypothetical protein